MIYVDDMQAPFGNMIMCHMAADSESELHAMARKIGVKRRWFQDGVSHPHYDISKGKRKLAVSYGAVEVTTRQLLTITRTRLE